MKKIRSNSQKEYRLTITTLLLLGLREFLINKFTYFTKLTPVLPKEVNGYILTKRMRQDLNKDTNRLGLYKNKTGKKIFGKMIAFKYKGSEYLNMQNEISVYRIINNYLNKRYKPNKAIVYRIPKYINSIETPNTLLLLLEYIEGIRGDKLSPKRKVQAYSQYLTFMQEVSHKLSRNERDLFAKRTPLNYLLLYPFLLLTATVRHPESIVSLLRGAVFFTRNFYLLFHQGKMVLSHRDLHFKNLIVNKDNIVLIDFESCVFTLPFFDLVTTLRHEWNDKYFFQELIKKIQNEQNNHKDFERYFRLLIVISCTHGLTANNFTKNDIHKIENFLKYANSFARK